MVEDREPDAPSLEPPSLFGRKKKAPKTAAKSAAGAAPPPAAAPAVEAPPVVPAEPPVVPVEEEPPEAPAPAITPATAGPRDVPTTIFEDASEPTPDVAPQPTEEVSAPTAAADQVPRPPREPWLGGTPAVVVTGLLVGALIVAATSGSFHICTKLKGTSSCGNTGFFMLVAILVVGVLVGAALLRGARVPDPGSTSFLAVGLLSVVTLLFLVGSIFEWWMIIAIPVASIATYLLSYWVTTTFIEPADPAAGSASTPEPHDVR